MERGGVVRDGRVPVNVTTADLNCTELEFDCVNEVNERKVIVHDPLASWNGIEFGDLLARADMGRVEPLLDFSSDNVRCRNSSFFLPGNGDVAVNAQHALCSNNAVSESQGGSVKKTTEGAMEEKIHSDQTLNSAASITTLDEQPRADKGEEHIPDLNATPQQKAKRRKHRPKVVIEGKVKVARKETANVSTPKSTEGKEKRKYAREKKSDDADNKTSKRKYVRKNVPTKSSSTATAKSGDMAVDTDNKRTKRKYVWKKVPPKSSSTAAAKGVEMSERDGCKKLKKSCRKVLDFDSDGQRPTPGAKENPIVLSDTDTEQEQIFSKTSGGRKCIQRKQLEGGRKGNYNNLSHSVDAKGQSQTRVCNGKYSFARTYQQLSKNGFKHTPARVKLEHHKGDEHSSITSIASSTAINGGNNGKLVKEWWHCNPKSPPTSDTAVRVSISSENEVTDTGPAQDANAEISSAPDFPVNQASLNDSLEEEVKPCTKLIDSKDCARLVRRNRIQKRKLDHISQSQRADMGQLITERAYTTLYHAARHVDAIWEYLISVDDIVERLKALDINRETNTSYYQCNILVPFDTRYGKKHIHNSGRNQREERTQLVIYNHNGTLIPFDNSQNRKRRPRAKVDLDEETSKVWRLLLENINSQGVDGTDEEKARWWENERKVFSGRANSFIARMHLVQGDRRFSKWKGSVVDSVVGVFLTQNVSDHLSSSAFMSLAARFPLKPNPNDKQYHKDVGCGANTVQVTHPEDSVPLNSNISNNPISDQVSSASNSENIEQKAVSTEGASNSGAMSSTDESVCKKGAFESEPQKIVETAGIQLNCNDAAEMSCLAENQQSQSDEVISSQSSATTYQCSLETLPSQTSERNMDFDLAAVSLPQANGGSTTFSQLLQMVGCVENQRGSLPCCNIEATAKDVQNRVDDVRLRDQLQNETDRSRVSTSSSIGIGIQQKEGTSMSSLMVHVDEDPIEVGKRGFRSLSSTTNLTDTESIKSSKVPKVVNKTYSSDRAFYESNIKSLKEKRRRVGKDIDHRFDWEGLRKETRVNGETRGKTPETMDSLDYEAVRSAEVNDIAYTIRERGMNNVLAGRIKDFLNRLVNEHGSIDLEWLRDVPPDQAKEYLLSIRGLGLKSVECVRLLTLHHLAFPVDTNVGRIAVRLGWVPLQPLPESLQLHLLEMYPVQESIQKYLWPRLCKLDQKTLYELHYQMITFGKVFCTKSKPNCNSCPMRGECRHFASAFASARLALPGPEEKRIVPSTEQRESFVEVPEGLSGQVPLLPHIVCPKQVPNANLQITQSSKSQSRVISDEPIIEEPKSPECVQIEEKDIEDCCYEESDEIPEIKLNIEEFTQSLQNYLHENTELEEGDVSRALIALTPEAASIPLPKLKNVSMLRTEHHVYELPDSHPLLEGLDKREPDDPCSYLLAIWTPGETANSVQPPELCTSRKTDKLCDKETCFSCNSSREANSHTVRGTLLIPCRTAMRGSFPLNGTYFQVNEVFADHDSSLSPMNIPRKWLWNLPRRTVYFGTSIPTIFKGLSTEGIQQCFWRGYVCVRGFDQKSRAPRPLLARLHFPASKHSRTKGKTSGEKAKGEKGGEFHTQGQLFHLAKK